MAPPALQGDTSDALSSDPGLAADIYNACHLTGSFVLRSGRHATHYFDKYRFEADPGLLRRTVAALVPLIPPETAVLAGLEMGGIPIATALSLETGRPAAFVRKVAKAYGTAKLAEGTEIDGKRVLVVEDVVTSGGQITLSVADLRERGAVVTHALCVIDREEGGRANLRDAGVELVALLTAEHMREAAKEAPAQS